MRAQLPGPRRPGHITSVLTGSLAAALLAAPGAAAAPAVQPAASCAGWTAVPAANPGNVLNTLSAVTVVSPKDVWAAGETFSVTSATHQTLIEHWNGSAWRVMPSPSPGFSTNFLTGVRQVSARDIWAVGARNDGGIQHTLIEHWNGHAWRVAPSPSPSSIFNELDAVSVVSATDIWAVGSYQVSSTRMRSLIVHWNGRRWDQVPSPTPRGFSGVTGVAATSASNAWAVGAIFNAHNRFKALMLRWNGRAWTQQATPHPGSDDQLSAVAARSAADAWAVGELGSVADGTPERTFTLHWNGRTWQQVTSPDAGGTASSNVLNAVAMSDAANAWAVGSHSTRASARTLILRWNGRKWSLAASPSPQTSSFLWGVAASGRGNAWAVGESDGQNSTRAITLHGCS